jgi:hypothetical protein
MRGPVLGLDLGGSEVAAVFVGGGQIHVAEGEAWC